MHSGVANAISQVAQKYGTGTRTVVSLIMIYALIVVNVAAFTGGGVIMEGRDIGTVVFPDAEVKIFLDADSSVRESRRVTQADAQDDPARAERLRQELRERDRRDSTRAAAPLKAAEDAVHIDSSGLSIEEVIARAEQIVAEKLKRLSA